MESLSVYRNEFPVTKNYTYLNHASVSPLPYRTVTSIRRLIEDQHLHGSTHYQKWFKASKALRKSAAALVHASPGEIAITKNTSEGLSVVANGLDWKSGDVAVGVVGEFPANYFPWKRLDRRGVKLRWIEQREGRIDLDDLDCACRGARLVALSFVQYISGFRVDLSKVGEICRRRGCLLVVDAVQGLGPFNVDVKKSGIHALSSSAHKWLLGPEGIGILFVDSGLIHSLEPSEFGWMNVEGWPNYSHEEKLALGAERYECGTLNTSGIYGLTASIDLLLEVGTSAMSERINFLADSILSGARNRGYQSIIPRDKLSGSGIVSIKKRGVRMEETVSELGRKGVAVSFRSGWLRAAPHFYQSEEEIQKFVDLLP